MSETHTLDWTFQMPPAGDGASGLEDYVVEDSRGEHVGKVATLLRHGDGLFAVVEHGTPPLRNELVAVPWYKVRDVDHDTLAVTLGLSRDELERLPRLDEDRKVEVGDADAVRVTDVPGEVRPAPVAARGPVDRSSYAVAMALGLLGVFATLVLVIFASGTDFDREAVLFVIPAALLTASGVLAYRTFRNPYERGSS
jgi:hypothetical protein